MEILLVGFHTKESMSWYIEKNLISLGHKVDVFCYRTISQKIGATSHLSTIFRHAPILDKVYLSKMNKELVSLVKKKKYDLCLVIKGETLFPETIDSLKDNCSKVVNWFPDPLVALEKGFLFDSVAKYDKFIVKDMFIKKRLDELGFDNIGFLLEAFDPEIYLPVNIMEDDKKKYGCNISFVGNIYPYRLRLLETLRAFNFKAWGGLSFGVTKDQVTPFYQGRKALAEEKNIIFNCAKIVFNSHNPWEVEGSNVRIFEICGSGAFQITDSTLYTKNIFTPGKEIVVYNNANELKKLIEYYLKNKDKRDEIKENGHKRALKDHTYHKRISELFKLIN